MFPRCAGVLMSPSLCAFMLDLRLRRRRALVCVGELSLASASSRLHGRALVGVGELSVTWASSRWCGRALVCVGELSCAWARLSNAANGFRQHRWCLQWWAPPGSSQRLGVCWAGVLWPRLGCAQPHGIVSAQLRLPHQARTGSSNTCVQIHSWWPAF